MLVTLLSVHAGVSAQGSAQANPGNGGNGATASEQQPEHETLASSFGPLALAALAVMTLLVRRRPMR